MQGTHEPDAERRHRNRVNLAAGIFLACLIALAIWTVKLFTDQEKLQRCLDSRRTSCFEVEQRRPAGIRVPTH